MDWGQLATKALISGVLIAAASEVSRRNPGLGGLIASLPLVSFVAMLWLWRDSGDPQRIADLAISSSAYVAASLPAFVLLGLLLRKGMAIPLAMLVFVAVGFAGYLAMQFAARRLGLPA